MNVQQDRVSSGVEGLDEILHGGFLETRSYMIRGPAGAGKTILAAEFLDAGVAAGESSLFVNLEEDIDHLRADLRALGYDVEGIEFLDLGLTGAAFAEEGSYSVFEASEVEADAVTDNIVEAIERVDPDRVVVDPLTQLEYLSPNDYQFRKQAVGMMRYLGEAGATVLFTVQDLPTLSTDDLEFVSDGAIVLDADGSIAVPKLRGSGTLRGQHAYRIDDDGVSAFPELQPGDRTDATELETLSAGVDEIDALLGGGIERGTTTVVSGPTGVGKTTLAAQFAAATAARDERSAIYLFEERERTFRRRSEATGIPVAELIDSGHLDVVSVEALELTPQEFARSVRQSVEDDNVRFVAIDGIAGYRTTLRGNSNRVSHHLHALGRYLGNAGVTTVFVDETREITGRFRATEDNISYLADSIIFLRHVELEGELQKVIGVLKKRTGEFEHTLRRFRITADGITVGEPLSNVRGILTGTPEFVDE